MEADALRHGAERPLWTSLALLMAIAVLTPLPYGSTCALFLIVPVGLPFLILGILRARCAGRSGVVQVVGLGVLAASVVLVTGAVLLTTSLAAGKALSIQQGRPCEIGLTTLTRVAAFWLGSGLLTAVGFRLWAAWPWRKCRFWGAVALLASPAALVLFLPFAASCPLTD